jgi:Ca-activated chloride channel family protein
MKRLPATYLGCLLIAALLAASAQGQGLLVVRNTSERVPLPRPSIRPLPTPPMSYKIKELGVHARVVDQVARVQVSQSFVNTGSRQMEVAFIFPLPYDGAIDSLTFLVDGKEFPAKLLPAEEARKIYEEHIRRNQDPALLEWIGTGMFQTSVFPVPPGAERKVTLHYNQLLRKDHDLTDFLFPLGTAKYTSKPVEKVEIRVSIESAIKIKAVYSPTHEINVKRSGPHNAVASYEGTNQVPANDFRLFCGVAKGKLGAGVLSYRPEADEDGYFLLLASPQIEASDAERPKKTVVCVLDRSGSMSGKKIEQAREALKFVVNNLREGDLFNIIAYDSTVEAFRPELQRYDEKTRLAALGFTESIYAGGSTNIHGALTTAMKMLQDSSRPNYVIFLTDGLPTAGVTNEGEIVDAAKETNSVRARLLNFGVGYDVNSRLLDRLSRSNFGQSLYVRPDEDIEEHVSRLYSRISSPVMTDVAVDFEFDELRVEEGKPTNRVYPQQLTDLFEGEQLVLVGRYKKHGPAKVRITGRVEGAQQKFDFPAELVKKSPDQSYGFVEKLWAMRRIGEIIDELDLKGRNEELIKELVELSARHGILTPYTSFLADEEARPGDLAATNLESNARRARAALGRLAETEGLAAFSQREAKQRFKEAELATPAESPAGEDGLVAGALLRDIEKDEDVRVDAVQVVGNKTLYRRGNVWYAYDAAKQDLEELGDKVQVIKRFSKEYFDLVRRNPEVLNRVMARQQAGEKLIIEAAAEPASAEAADEAAPSAIYQIE